MALVILPHCTLSCFQYSEKGAFSDGLAQLGVYISTKVSYMDLAAETTKSRNLMYSGFIDIVLCRNSDFEAEVVMLIYCACSRERKGGLITSYVPMNSNIGKRTHGTSHPISLITGS